jgi:Zn-dependent protease with chaperone function
MVGKTRTLALLFTFFICSLCKGQLIPVYSFQQDDTLQKRKYYNEALAKKKLLIDGLEKDKIKDYKGAYEDMFEVVEDLLLSPRSVTEQKADEYIKLIVAKIINANPELKGLDLRVVFSRDLPPNAFSIGDGTIAFNAGLFVFLENEAEMTFVLCHELAHYYLQHSKKNIDRQVAIIHSDSLKKEIKRLSKLEYRVGEQFEKLMKLYVFDIRRHSRDREEEADRVGLRFLKNTGYNGDGFITVMKLLDKVDDTTLFTPLNLQKVFAYPGSDFKEKWIKKESVIFGALNPDDATGLTKKERDSLKTHPDCVKRIALLKDSASTISGTHFLVNEKLFRQLKADFVPEIVEETYKSGNISINLYLSLQMLQDGKYTPLAIYSIARDFNLIYKHQKDHEMGLIIDSENKRYDEGYNLLIRMLYRMRLNEIAELNDNFCSFYQEQMKNYEGFAGEMEKAKENKLAHQ